VGAVAVVVIASKVLLEPARTMEAGREVVTGSAPPVAEPPAPANAPAAEPPAAEPLRLDPRVLDKLSDAAAKRARSAAGGARPGLLGAASAAQRLAHAHGSAAGSNGLAGAAPPAGVGLGGFASPPAAGKSGPASAGAAAKDDEARKPDDATSQEALTRRAEELFAARRWSEAIAAYRELLRRYPDADLKTRWRARLTQAQAASGAPAGGAARAAAKASAASKTEPKTKAEPTAAPAE